MKRNTLAVAAGIALALGSSTVVTADASFVNTSAVVMLQGQAASRWQADRFGPIVSSDTLWSIAMYYGDRTDLSVYEMMDLFIELNPEAFINGRADRMMDGYYLKVPPAAQAQRAASAPVVTGEPAETAPTEEADKPASPGAVTETPESETPEAETPAADNAEPATGGTVQYDVQELSQLRNQLAESIDLIERLNSENNALQERLDSVTAQLEQMQLKMNAEQRAESDLQQQIEAELAATQQEQTDATDSPTAVTEEPKTDDATSTEAVVEAETKPEPVATPKPAPRKKQSDYEAFVEWLLQPFQLTLAILIPLLLAAIIWYMLYVRRLNREHLGPYNGAMQAAAKEKEQGKEESTEKLSAFEEAEQAAAAEEAADMPEFERLDDEDDYAQLEDDVEDEATQLDDELAALDDEAASPEPEQPTDNDDDTDLDSLLASSFDEEEAKEETIEEAAVEPEPEEILEPEAESEPEVELEPEVAPETKSEQDNAPEAETEISSDDDMSLDFHIDDKPADDKPAPADVDVELEQFEDINLDDIDLEGLSAEEPSDDSDSQAETELTLDEDASDEFLEIDALLQEAESEDSDFESPRFEREAGQVDDSEETPSGILDLARAYMDMDEYDLARDELEKVAASDDEDAKREAAMLLQKIEEQGH